MMLSLDTRLAWFSVPAYGLEVKVSATAMSRAPTPAVAHWRSGAFLRIASIILSFLSAYNAARLFMQRAPPKVHTVPGLCQRQLYRARTFSSSTHGVINWLLGPATRKQ